jgi:hypothetical protein
MIVFILFIFVVLFIFFIVIVMQRNAITLPYKSTLLQDNNYNPSVVDDGNHIVYSFRKTPSALGSCRKRILQHKLDFGPSSHIILKDGIEYEIERKVDFTEEDGRLLYIDNRYYLFVTRKYKNKSNTMGFIEFIINDTITVISEGEFNIPGCQKNWSPVKINNSIYLVANISPITIVYLFDGKEITLHKSIRTNFDEIRGGTQLIQINDKLYGIGHTKHWLYGFKHVIYCMDLDFNLCSLSENFIFDRSNFRFDVPGMIEFASGITKINNMIHVTYGVWNENSSSIDIPIFNFVSMANTFKN